MKGICAEKIVLKTKNRIETVLVKIVRERNLHTKARLEELEQCELALFLGMILPVK